MRVWIPDPVADALIARGMANPYPTLENYMERGLLLGRKQFADLAEPPRRRVRIHHILASDPGRHMHTHPWTFVSVILRGGYLEHLPRNQQQHARLDFDPEHRISIWRGKGDIIVRRFGERHYIEKPAELDTYTMVLTGKKQGEWGYETEEGFVHWLAYRQWVRDRYGPLAADALPFDPEEAAIHARGLVLPADPSRLH